MLFSNGISVPKMLIRHWTCEILLREVLPTSLVTLKQREPCCNVFLFQGCIQK